MLHPAPSAALATSGAASLSLANDGTRVSTVRALIALTKPRLAAMSVLTTAIAYVVAPRSGGWSEAIALLIGTVLSAAGALALNQWRERDTDRLMERTRNRPLPAGLVTVRLALAWCVVLSVGGVALLATAVNPLAAAISALTILLYAFVYTPLKRRTRWATELGAIPGALPPLIGWAAAEGAISTFGWLLFALLVFWQMPHFFAIGWSCRDEYRRAGFPLLPVIDESGARTAGWSFAHTGALLIVSLLPCAFGFASAVFGAVALIAGAGMLWRAWQFVAAIERDAAARRLFLASLGYLPLVLAALVVDAMM